MVHLIHRAFVVDAEAVIKELWYDGSLANLKTTEFFSNVWQSKAIYFCSSEDEHPVGGLSQIHQLWARAGTSRVYAVNAVSVFAHLKNET